MSGSPPSLIWGILGGMGPLASAAFLQTIYEQYRDLPEQGMPVCLMVSDPTIPDRTTRLLAGEEEELAERLTAGLETLAAMGAERFLIACVTIHAVLPRVPDDLRRRVISLLDVVSDEVRARRRRQLLACTLGTYRLDLFKTLDPETSRWLVVPSREDQEEIHRVIYQIKAGADLVGPLASLKELLHRYQVRSFVAGCTELHLLTRRLPDDAGFSFIDPLDIVARRQIGRVGR